MKTKRLWKVFAWISMACALLAYLMGWIALFGEKVIWNIPTQYWFYDAFATGIFAVFFLIYSVHSKK